MSDLAQQASGNRNGWGGCEVCFADLAWNSKTDICNCLSDVRLFESIMGVVNLWNHHLKNSSRNTGLLIYLVVEGGGGGGAGRKEFIFVFPSLPRK